MRSITDIVGHFKQNWAQELSRTAIAQACRQAVRIGNWKAVRPKLGQPIELYDLSTDPGERRDVGGEHPEVVAKAATLFETARTESPHWPVKRRRAAGK